MLFLSTLFRQDVTWLRGGPTVVSNLYIVNTNFLYIDPNMGRLTKVCLVLCFQIYKIITEKTDKFFLAQIPSPGSSGKPLKVEKYFFLAVAERPTEAPSGA